MKRITIAMSDELYADLLEYAADQSKRNLKRLSLGEAVRTLVSVELAQMGYERSKERARAPKAARAQLAETAGN